MEIYLSSNEVKSGNQKQLEKEDKYWLDVFQGFANGIGSGMKQFMCTMLSKLAI